MRTIYLASVVALSTGAFYVAQAAGPVVGVSVTRSTARFDRASRNRAAVDIELANNSGKTATAWSYVVEGTYADGSVARTTATVDNVTALLTPETNSGFRSGTSHAFTAMLPLGKLGDIPVTASARLEMVAFEDGSATGDSQAVLRMSGRRRSMAAMMSAMLDEIQAARNAPDPKAAMQAVDARHSKAGEGGIMVLQLVPLLDQPETLERALAGYRSVRDLLMKHSVLKGGD